jgi:hypothetical protein
VLAAHIEQDLEDDDPDGWLFRTPNGTPPTRTPSVTSGAR